MAIGALARISRDRYLMALGDGELPAYFTREEVDRILGQVEGRAMIYCQVLAQNTREFYERMVS